MKIFIYLDAKIEDNDLQMLVTSLQINLLCEGQNENINE